MYVYTHNDTKYYSIIAYRHISELMIYAILKLYFGYIIVYMYIIIHIKYNYNLYSLIMFFYMLQQC